jgi:hypothetical protein
MELKTLPNGILTITIKGAHESPSLAQFKSLVGRAGQYILIKEITKANLISGRIGIENNQVER